jgi:hypothetical protein
MLFRTIQPPRTFSQEIVNRMATKILSTALVEAMEIVATVLTVRVGISSKAAIKT